MNNLSKGNSYNCIVIDSSSKRLSLVIDKITRLFNPNVVEESIYIVEFFDGKLNYSDHIENNVEIIFFKLIKQLHIKTT